MSAIVSVIVPCYKQADYMQETLQSVLDQEFQDWECIIINDGSPDNTEEIARQWCEKDSRFRYLYKENSGVSDTRNYGIKRAEGEFIMPLDGDDLIASPYLKEAVDVFRSQPDVKLVYSNTLVFGVKSSNKPGSKYNYREMYIENQIPNTAVYRKSDFLQTIGYNVNMANGLEDWEFWLTLLNEEDKVVKLDGFYYLYRTKDVSRSTKIDHKRNEDLLIQIFKNQEDKYLRMFNPIRDHIEADYYKRQSHYLQNCADYKIGKFILAPLRFIGKVFRKISK